MDLWKNIQAWQGYRCWTTEGFLLNIIVWLLNVTTPHAVSAAAGKIQTFDGSITSGLPMFTCGVSGWSIEQTNQGNRIVATCPNMCIYRLTVIEGASFERGSGTVTFSYAINVPDGFDASVDPDSGPVLSLYCFTCSQNKVWSSLDTSPSQTGGVWVSASVDIKHSGSFSLALEAKIGASGQVIGVDDLIVQGNKPRKPPLPTIPLEIPSNCFSGEDPTDNDANLQSTTHTPGEEVEDVEGYPLTIGFQTPNPDVTTDESTGSDSANSFKLLDHETTLLLAQILAVLSVAVCVVTVTVHCVIWGKQRKLQKVRSMVPLRRQRSSEPEPHDSMLLEMSLVPTEEPDQPCSNSLCRPSKDMYLAKLKESDILKQQDPRRATISHGISQPRQGALVDVEDDSDVEQQRPHPRTKSLPGRPINEYESIDEMSKYQPLRFEKRPAPKQKPPGIPGGRRLNERTRGVQNLAVARKNRPSSVQYEEVRNRLVVPFEEPRDRSKSASNYDYIKRKASSQMHRRGVLKYGQSPRPKGRAPPPPVNRLYDKPLKKTKHEGLVSSAPQLLLISRDSSRESVRTDTESIPEESEGYSKPSTSTFGTPVRPVRPAVESAYFTLEPNINDYSSGDSDDECDSPPDASRFEDAEEVTATPRSLPNGRGGASLGPLQVSAPIIIPPSPVSPSIDNYEEETSCL